MPVMMFMLTPRASFQSDYFMVTKEEEQGGCGCIQSSCFLLLLVSTIDLYYSPVCLHTLKNECGNIKRISLANCMLQ